MMRKLFYLLIPVYLVACHSNSGKAGADQSSSPVSGNSSNALDTSISFSGFYLNEHYLATLQETKSPRKAQLENDDTCFVIIPDRTLKETELVFNFHEGRSDLAVVKSKSQYELWIFENRKPAEFCTHISMAGKGKIKVGNKTFVKICDYYEPGKNDEGAALKALWFNGQYMSEQGDMVEFKRDGQLTGLGSFRYYSPIMDYYDIGMQIDMLRLGQTENATENFGFKFKQDTLLIYKMKCIDSSDNLCKTVDYDKLMYKLTKINLERKMKILH